MRRLRSAHRPRGVGERDGDLGLAPRRDAPRPARGSGKVTETKTLIVLGSRRGSG
jgi:hypothetical protein